jgi:hypothetical protein
MVDVIRTVNLTKYYDNVLASIVSPYRLARARYMVFWGLNGAGKPPPYACCWE